MAGGANTAGELSTQEYDTWDAMRRQPLLASCEANAWKQIVAALLPVFLHNSNLAIVEAAKRTLTLRPL